MKGKLDQVIPGWTKTFVWLLALSLLLTGCSYGKGEESLEDTSSETVADDSESSGGGTPVAEGITGSFSIPAQTNLTRIEGDAGKFFASEEYDTWSMEHTEAQKAALSVHEQQQAYEEKILPLLLSEDENQTASPLSIFFALSMLAQTTDGQSRQQILDALCASDTK